MMTSPGVFTNLLDGFLICPGPVGGLLHQEGTSVRAAWWGRVCSTSPHPTGHHFILFPLSSMVVFKFLEQTGRVGAGEPLADIYPGMQPEGGGHHAPAPGQDAPASETHRVSAVSAHPSTHCWPTSVGPNLAPAVASWWGLGSLGREGHSWKKYQRDDFKKAPFWPPQLQRGLSQGCHRQHLW